MQLSVEEKTILLKAARQSIDNSFRGLPPERVDYEKHPMLKTNSGAFVTLTERNSLRGCIGYIVSDNFLFDTVCDAARRAAFNDPRFPELQHDELEKVEIEISVLSPPFNMEKYEDIVLGVHGLILEDYGRRALLLPQVPVEHNMDLEQYLCAICDKAGLPSDMWKQKTLNMKLFTAQVFSEDEIGRHHYAGG